MKYAADRTKVTLFPSHQLVFSAHCANLPALQAPSQPSSSDTERCLLVVPFHLPVPAALPLLYSYLYTIRADVLLGALEPEHENDIASLTRAAALIQALSQNTCVLGVVDNVLYDTLDFAWGRVVTVLKTRSPTHDRFSLLSVVCWHLGSSDHTYISILTCYFLCTLLFA
jgi:hypothetical protein